MTILRILTWPDQRLRDVAEPVTEWNNELTTLVADLFETMYDDEGVGLAATKWARQRVIVLDCGHEAPNPIAMINPVIDDTEGETTFAEGCLQAPYGLKWTEAAVTVQYTDIDGASQTLVASGLLAICIQHEIDHLDGKLYFDHLLVEQKAFLQAYHSIEGETEP